jgi:hypothetical protein
VVADDDVQPGLIETLETSTKPEPRSTGGCRLG